MDRRKFELHNISTDQILQDFKVTFKDYLKKANKEGLECGFGIAYNDAKKSWKSALCQGMYWIIMICLPFLWPCTVQTIY
jgi:hypothetical protein